MTQVTPSPIRRVFQFFYKEILPPLILAACGFLVRSQALGDGYTKNQFGMCLVSLDIIDRRYFPLMVFPYCGGLFNWIVSLFFVIFETRSVLIPQVVTVFVGLGSILVTYYLGRLLFDKSIGFLAGLIAVVHTWFVAMSLFGSQLGDSFFIFAAILFYMRHYRGKGKWNLVMAGVLAALGAQIRTIPLLAVVFCALFTWIYCKNFKQAFVEGLWMGASALAAFSPVIIWNIQHGFATFSLSVGTMTGRGFGHAMVSRGFFDQIPQKFLEWSISLVYSISGRYSGVGVDTFSGNPVSVFLFFIGLAIAVWQWRKQKDLGTSFSLYWLLCNAILFTFFITWLENASNVPGGVPHRPSRYQCFLFPIPYYFISIAVFTPFRKTWAWIKKKAKDTWLERQWHTILVLGLTCFIALVLVVGTLLKGTQEAAPASQNHLAVIRYLDRQAGPNPILMTDFFVAAQGDVIDHNLNYSWDQLIKENNLPDRGNYPDYPYMVQQSMLYPFFFYSTFPEGWFIKLKGASGTIIPTFFALVGLPVYPFKLLEQWQHIDIGSPPYQVWYVFREPGVEDGLAITIGVQDYQFEQDLAEKRLLAANPELKPVNYWQYKGVPNFVAYRYVFTPRLYKEGAFEFGLLDEPASPGYVKILRSSRYLPWSGFGWRHTWLWGEHFNIPGGDHAEGLTPLSYNSFMIDVAPGRYSCRLVMKEANPQYLSASCKGQTLWPPPSSLELKPVPGGFRRIAVEFEVQINPGEKLKLDFVPDMRVISIDDQRPEKDLIVAFQFRQIESAVPQRLLSYVIESQVIGHKKLEAAQFEYDKNADKDKTPQN